MSKICNELKGGGGMRYQIILNESRVEKGTVIIVVKTALCGDGGGGVIVVLA